MVHSSRVCLVGPFFLGSQKLEASAATSICFPLALPLEKIAPTASSPEAKLVEMLNN